MSAADTIEEALDEKVEGADQNLAEDGDQYLTFIMDNEEYGVDILSVQEIRGWEPATIIPNAPPFTKGVINLRGTIVPIIDLRLRFGIEPKEYDATTVVVILRNTTTKGSKVIGVVVDAVSEVYNIVESDIKTDAISERENMQFIKGLTTAHERMVVLLNIDELMKIED